MSSCIAIRELVARINFAIYYAHNTSLASQLRKICDWLIVMSPDPDITVEIEKWIDAMDRELPRLTVFILPGGKSQLGARLHLCRTACRTSERIMVGEGADRDALQFINRLSDYFFTAARFADEHISLLRET